MIRRISVGKPIEYGGGLYRVYRLQDEALVDYSSLEVVQHDPEDGSIIRASGPISMLPAVWSTFQPWLSGSVGIKPDASYWPAEYVPRRHDDPSHSPQVVIAGDLLLLDTPRGVIVAWSLVDWEEAWRLDLSTTYDLKFLRLLLCTSGRIVCSLFRQILRDVVYKDLDHLTWSNFPDAWAQPVSTTSTTYLDLAGGHAIQHSIATFDLSGSHLYTYTFPPATDKLACGNVEWVERLETRINLDFFESASGNFLGVLSEGGGNHEQISVPEHGIPRRDYVLEQVLGTATLYDRTIDPTASVTATVDLRTQWDGSQRGTAPTSSVTPSRTWRAYAHEVSDAYWQGIINDQQGLEEGYDTMWGDNPGYNPATRQYSAFASTVFSALGHPVLSGSGDGVGRVDIEATQTLYGVYMVPGEAFEIFRSAYERSSPWYCCSNGSLLVLGPAQDPDHPGDTAWTALRLEDLEVEWIYSESISAACSAPIFVGDQIYTVVDRPEAPALVVLGVDGIVQQEFDLTDFGPLSEQDLSFQLVSDGRRVFFLCGGKLYALTL